MRGARPAFGLQVDRIGQCARPLERRPQQPDAARFCAPGPPFQVFRARPAAFGQFAAKRCIPAATGSIEKTRQTSTQKRRRLDAQQLQGRGVRLQDRPVAAQHKARRRGIRCGRGNFRLPRKSRHDLLPEQGILLLQRSNALAKPFQLLRVYVLVCFQHLFPAG